MNHVVASHSMAFGTKPGKLAMPLRVAAMVGTSMLLWAAILLPFIA